jgi:hypothetical protein
MDYVGWTLPLLDVLTPGLSDHILVAFPVGERFVLDDPG